MIGTSEIVIIAVVVLILFGSAALPKFAKSLGKAKKEFQEGLKDSEAEETDKKNQS